MDSLTVKLECLRLAASRVASRDPKEIVELAKAFEIYVSESSPTCSPQKSGEISGTLEQKPNDAVKAQHNSPKGFKK